MGTPALKRHLAIDVNHRVIEFDTNNRIWFLLSSAFGDFTRNNRYDWLNKATSSMFQCMQIF